MSREQTLKLRFEISAEEHERLRAALFDGAGQEVEASRHTSVYIDTPDLTLRAQDALWCFSRKDKMRNGAPKAGEWRLDRDNGARSYVKKHRLFNDIGGVFRLRLDRLLVLHHAEKVAAEVSLERADLRNGDQAVLISHVQFNLRDGTAKDFAQFILQVLPQAVPVSESMSFLDYGYGLSEKISPAGTQTEARRGASSLDKDMPTGEAFKFLARAELDAALALPPLQTGSDVLTHLQTIRRVQSVFRFFAGETDRGGSEFAGWAAALIKVHDLDAALTVYLAPAAKRGGWDMASGLVARIGESRARAYAALTQTWPDERVKNLFAAALGRIGAEKPSSSAGDQDLVAFLSKELAKTTDDIQAFAAEKSTLRLGQIRDLSEKTRYLQDVITFLEPLTKGKAARRRETLHEALCALERQLDKENHLNLAQMLVADAAAHIAHLKQTKTQIAQTFAAGALAGFLEAKKGSEPQKALKAALAEFSDIKPFWTKIA